ncbi:MAG: hypothetical protein KDJ52_34570 [Anaerolineae bacterium]|nr:hypothetical protein [Anaerolineae bacterium]
MVLVRFEPVAAFPQTGYIDQHHSPSEPERGERVVFHKGIVARQSSKLNSLVRSKHTLFVLDLHQKLGRIWVN